MMNVVGSLRPSEKSPANVIIRRLVDRLEGRTILREQYLDRDANLLIQWGFKPTKAMRSAIFNKIPFVIVDMGYFDWSDDPQANRSNRYSISINGLHGTSMQLDGVYDLPPRPHPKVMPWRTERKGKEVLVLGQMPGDAALRGADIEAWMNRAATEAADVFKMKTIKRPHPRMLNPWEPTLPPLEDTFKDTHVYVTYSSTAAVQTVLAGVPTIAMHPCSPAYRMSAHRMSRQIFPGREAWAHDLSHREYALLDDKDCDAACDYIIRGFEQGLGPAALGKVDTEGVRP